MGADPLYPSDSNKNEVSVQMRASHVVLLVPWCQQDPVKSRVPFHHVWGRALALVEGEVVDECQLLSSTVSEILGS